MGAMPRVRDISGIIEHFGGVDNSANITVENLSYLIKTGRIPALNTGNQQKPLVTIEAVEDFLKDNEMPQGDFSAYTYSNITKNRNRNGTIGSIYFVKDCEFVKIGMTLNPIEDRVESFRTGNPRPLELAFALQLYYPNSCSGLGKLESLIHSICKDSHYNREWFYYHGAMRSVFTHFPIIKKQIEDHTNASGWKFMTGANCNTATNTYRYRTD